MKDYRYFVVGNPHFFPKTGNSHIATQLLVNYISSGVY